MTNALDSAPHRLSARRGLVVGFAVALTVLVSAPAQAALSLRFDPAEAAPGTKVVARTEGEGALAAGRGESFPVFLVDLPIRKRVGVLKVDQAGNGTLRFEVPVTLPDGDYEVELRCPPCAATSAGREDLPVGEFTIVEAPGEPFPAFPYDIANVVWVGLWVVFAVLLARKLWRWWRGRSPAGSIEADPSKGLPAGALMSSPSLGWGDLGWGDQRRGFFVPDDAVGHHIIIGGGTGSGKTNSAEILEYAAAETYRPQIIHFDCKGSRDGMARFVALMAAAGITPDRVRLFPVEAYDGWRGGSDPERALLARLVQIQDWNESFYEAGTKDMLQSVLFDTTLPKSSAEFLARLEQVPAGANPKLIEGAKSRYRGFYRSLKGLLDGAWAFEDCDACYIQLEGFGLPSEAVALGRFLLEDLTHYLADRKTAERRVLVVLDEFSAISTGADAANLVERAREFGAGVILTTQSYAGLGRNAERVLDAARGALIIHSVANPEPFTSRAGTVWRHVQAITEPTHQPGVISSILFETKPPETPRKTTREQEFPRIDPNEVRQLPKGEAFVISSGRAQRVRFNEAALWDENLDLARAEIERRRRGAVATRGGNGHAPPPVEPPTDDDPLDF